MYRSHIENSVWTVTLGGRTIAMHSPEKPFIFAIRKEKTYVSNRGTVKETIVEKARIALTELKTDEDGALLFSAGDRTVRVCLSEPGEGMLRLAIGGEEGWGYEFALPADPEEGIFGGGEQYRQVDLKGEAVVNFVSEHIKAKTLIEKTLLPRAFYQEKPHKEIGSYAPMPVFVSDRGLMVLFETPYDGVSSLDGSFYRFGFDACPEEMILSQADSFREQAKRLARLHPVRQYLPDWCLDGMIVGVQGGTERVLEKAFALQEAGARVAGVWCP